MDIYTSVDLKNNLTENAIIKNSKIDTWTSETNLEGGIRYNNHFLEYYNGTEWVRLSSSSGGEANIIENIQYEGTSLTVNNKSVGFGLSSTGNGQLIVKDSKSGSTLDTINVYSGGGGSSVINGTFAVVGGEGKVVGSDDSWIATVSSNTSQRSTLAFSLEENKQVLHISSNTSYPSVPSEDVQIDFSLLSSHYSHYTSKDIIRKGDFSTPNTPGTNKIFTITITHNIGTKYLVVSVYKHVVEDQKVRYELIPPSDDKLSIINTDNNITKIILKNINGDFHNSDFSFVIVGTPYLETIPSSNIEVTYSPQEDN